MKKNVGYGVCTEYTTNRGLSISSGRIFRVKENAEKFKDWHKKRGHKVKLFRVATKDQIAYVEDYR